MSIPEKLIYLEYTCKLVLTGVESQGKMVDETELLSFSMKPWVQFFFISFKYVFILFVTH